MSKSTTSGKWAWVAVAGLWMLAVHACRADEPTDVSADLEALVKQHKVPALGVAVLEGDRLVKVGAAGVRARGNEAKVQPGDLWHIGSCTKAMTATLCAILVERGKLKWDSTLGEVFADQADQIHADLRGVTLEQLLSHRAGLPANAEGTLWRKLAESRESRDAREMLLREGVLKKAPHSAPGSKFLYSNLGYMMAGLMAERVMDKDWETLLREELFEPLEMKSAGFGSPGTADAFDQPRGHLLLGPPIRPGSQADNPRGLGPAGTVHCSLSDWSKFIALHLQAARGESRLLSRESFQKLHTPQGEDRDAYALGWLTPEREWAGGPALMHNGTNTLWYCVVWIAPKKNFAVLCTCNTGPLAGAPAADAAAVLMIRQAGLLPPATEPSPSSK